MDNKYLKSELMNSDFTLLLRENNESNNAGFPTKVAESISLGVPPLLNFTSDIKDYLYDKINCIEIPDIHNLEEIVTIVIRILKMNDTELNNLRNIELTYTPFFYQRYSDIFAKFIEN
jgi:hypothetical protein